MSDAAMQLIASLVKSAAWPMTLLSSLFLFRIDLRKLLGRIKEISVTKNGMSGTFDRELQTVSENVREAEIETASSVTPDKRELLDRGEHLQGNKATVAATWLTIEDKVRRRVNNAGGAVDALGSSNLLKVALERGLITIAQWRSLVGLNTMRNLAVHGGSEELDDRRTQEFLHLAEAVKTVLEITESENAKCR
jgi:hypothetical protein